MRSNHSATVLLFAALVCGCDRGGNKGATRDSPEGVYRAFLLAELETDEAKIRPLILDHPDASILWPDGEYPDDVKALLKKQCESTVIERLEESPDRVRLKSDTIPFALDVVRVDDSWKVDASKLIEVRKATQKP
jgi:hypothetical protein